MAFRVSVMVGFGVRVRVGVTVSVMADCVVYPLLLYVLAKSMVILERISKGEYDGF